MKSVKYFNIKSGNLLLGMFCLVLLTNCSKVLDKLISIDPPPSSINSDITFSDSINATAAINGIYYLMNDITGPFNGGRITSFMGLYSDELIASGTDEPFLVYAGKLDSRMFTVYAEFWKPFYQIIYRINLCIEELEKSKTLQPNVKNILVGESKFLRAYVYYYLSSIYGEVPLVLSSDFLGNTNRAKSSIDEIHQQMLKDLEDAELVLPADYSHAKGNRVRANKYAVFAMKARIYMEISRYTDAEVMANKVIIEGSSFYELANQIGNIFDTNGKEAILQLYLANNRWPYCATGEGVQFIPFPNSIPNTYLRKEFVDAFSKNDLRRKIWIDSIEYDSEKYFIPKKYILGPRDARPDADIPQYYTLLRLTEMYLIRSEARARRGDFSGAIEDLHIIRNRAGLDEELISSSKEQILEWVYIERRFELMAEMGHRWFDLKRYGKADEVNALIKPDWAPFKKVFPIPWAEINLNPALKQHAGYE